jgi:hypothetical protein
MCICMCVSFPAFSIIGSILAGVYSLDRIVRIWTKRLITKLRILSIPFMVYCLDDTRMFIYGGAFEVIVSNVFSGS